MALGSRGTQPSQTTAYPEGRCPGNAPALCPLPETLAWLLCTLGPWAVQTAGSLSPTPSLCSLSAELPDPIRCSSKADSASCPRPGRQR